METALQFQSVSKRFGTAPALREVSFAVPKGEFFGLAGMNGAGKTTLIKSLLGLSDIDGGSISIFGKDHRATASREPMAFLPERFTPPYYLTGRDFLRYMLKLRGLTYQESRAETMLDALDLERSALSKPVRAYSKGMTQKLGLAACLLCNRRLYVLDEPMSGLDPKARALTKQLLAGLKREGCTVFLTSHSLADVAEICDRMAILHQGELRFEGRPDDLCRNQDAPDLEQAFLRCIA